MEVTRLVSDHNSHGTWCFNMGQNCESHRSTQDHLTHCQRPRHFALSFLHKVCVWRNDERSNRWRRATKCQQGASKSTVALVAPIGTLKLISNLPKMLADYFNHPQCLEQNCQTLRLCFNDDLIGAPYLGKTLSLPTFTSTLRLGYPKLTSAPRLLRGPICHLCGG